MYSESDILWLMPAEVLAWSYFCRTMFNVVTISIQSQFSRSLHPNLGLHACDIGTRGWHKT